MSDSKEVVAQQPVAAKPTPKSYTERFADMEVAIARMSYVVNFHTNAMADMMTRMEEMLTTLNTLRNSQAATMKLAEEGVTATFENVTNKILKLQAQAHKESIEKDLADGVIVKSDEVRTGSSIIAYESLPEIEYGQGILAMFPKEDQPLLLGKREGDTVNSMKILGVYEQAPTPSKDVDNGSGSGQEKES